MLNALAETALFACIFLILTQLYHILRQLFPRCEESLTERASGSKPHETCAIAPEATAITTMAALNRRQRFLYNDEMVVIVEPEYSGFSDAELVNTTCEFRILPKAMFTHLRPCQYDLLEMTLVDLDLALEVQSDFWSKQVQTVPLAQRLAYIESLHNQLPLRCRSPLQSLW